MNLESLKEKITQTAQLPTDQPLQELCNLLKEEVDHYNWVGFYFMNNDRKELVIGPYAGKTTDHTRIPYGRGICGQVAVSGETFVVPDVKAQDNYLACSLETRSEIVVPIYKNKELVGQIDIDSDQLDPFSEKDEALLAFVADLVVTKGWV